MTVKEIIYLDCDNSIDLLLKADGTAQDLSTVTQIDAVFNDNITMTSTNQSSDPIRWNQAGYDTGEIRISPSESDEEDLVDGTLYAVNVIVYDPSNTNGVYWGTIGVTVKAVK